MRGQETFLKVADQIAWWGRIERCSGAELPCSNTRTPSSGRISIVTGSCSPSRSNKKKESRVFRRAWITRRAERGI